MKREERERTFNELTPKEKAETLALRSLLGAAFLSAVVSTVSELLIFVELFATVKEQCPALLSCLSNPTFLEGMKYFTVFAVLTSLLTYGTKYTLNQLQSIPKRPRNISPKK